MRILVLGQRTFLILPTLPRRHLTGENPGSDGVDPDLDPLVADFRGEHLREVVGRGFGGVVGEMALGFEDRAGDGGDVDDAPRVAVLVVGGFLEEGQEGEGGEVELGGVDFIFRGPIIEISVFGVEEVLLEIFWCVAFCVKFLTFLDSCVVDQDAEAFFTAFDLFGEALDVGFVGDVGGDGDDLAGDVLPMFLDYGVELLLGAAHDVDFGAVYGEGLSTH